MSRSAGGLLRQGNWRPASCGRRPGRRRRARWWRRSAGERVGTAGWRSAGRLTAPGGDRINSGRGGRRHPGVGRSATYPVAHPAQILAACYLAIGCSSGTLMAGYPLFMLMSSVGVAAATVAPVRRAPPGPWLRGRFVVDATVAAIRNMGCPLANAVLSRHTLGQSGSSLPSKRESFPEGRGFEWMIDPGTDPTSPYPEWGGVSVSGWAERGSVRVVRTARRSWPRRSGCASTSSW
jgi:hypothetical protein